MKKSLLSLLMLLVLLVPMSLYASTVSIMPASEYKICNGADDNLDQQVGHPTLYVFTDADVKSGFGGFLMTGYSNHTKDCTTYGQVYGGPRYKFGDIVEAGLGIGLERDNTTIRVRRASVLLVSYPVLKVPVSLNWIHEESTIAGENTGWNRFELYGQLMDHYLLGMTAQSSLGAGPRFGLSYGDLNFWINTMYDGTRWSSISSVSYAFKRVK